MCMEKKFKEKQFERFLKIENREKIELDLMDNLNLLAFGKTDVVEEFRN